MKKQIFNNDIKDGNMTINDSYVKQNTSEHKSGIVNINPLKDIPKSLIRLYGFTGVYQNIYFNTEEELNEYINNHSTVYGDVCILDYLGNVAGFNNVIRKTYDDGYFVLYSQVEENKYAIYNYEKSAILGKYIWNYVDGNLNEEYNALMKYSGNSLSKILKKKIN